MTDSIDENAWRPEGPLLVTGAGGFVGGHVARTLARMGLHVRGLVRRSPPIEPDDPPIEWVHGDLRSRDVRARALEGCRGVIHTAGWVHLGPDPRGEARAVNVEATAALLDEGRAAGVERFVYTSTLWTVARGTPECPADEDADWNLDVIRGPYSETKREAERLVLARHGARMRTTVLCPGLVVGPRDVRPTSTRLLLEMAKSPVVLLPRGGIPIVDARVLALAHARALLAGEGGRRYVVAGPYLSYRDLAVLVARVAGRPRRVWTVPDLCDRPLTRLVRLAERWGLTGSGEISAAAVAGGFLRLHVQGTRADAAFGLVHPPPQLSVFDALDDHLRSGRAAWLGLRPPDLAGF